MMECDKCGAEMRSYEELGYDGGADEDGNPAPEVGECFPAMPWLVLCKRCSGAAEGPGE
jgi:hypothetical protein